MQQLIQNLLAGTVEYKDDLVIRHPPNSLMLQAARTLEQVIPSLETNQILINQLQTHQEENLTIMQQLRVEINELQRRIQELSEAKADLQRPPEATSEGNSSNESVCQSGGQTSDVGSIDGEHPGSNSNS